VIRGDVGFEEDVMGSGTLDRASGSRVPASDAVPRPRRIQLRQPTLEPMPDEPLAVVAVGAAGSGRSDVVGALLGGIGPVLDVPPASFLVVHHGHGRDICAYLPGARQAHPYRCGAIGDEPVLARPPRRVEVTLPDPLLRHFALVDTPDTGVLGVAGGRVVRDAVERGGALLFVQAADRLPDRAEFELLAEVAQTRAAVFFVVTPRADGTWLPPEVGALGADPDPVDLFALAGDGMYGIDGIDLVPELDGNDPAAGVVEAHRLAMAAAVPALAEASWFAIDPAATDTAYLRRALTEWAAGEGMSRASANPPVPPGATRTVKVAADAHESAWAARLEKQARAEIHLVRQRLALELANIHLRVVQEIVFGAGCPGLPDALDREVHALSLRAMAECDAAVDRMLVESVTQVLGDAPDEGVRRRVAAAVRRSFADDAGAKDLDRVLLVTSTAGVGSVTGPGAVAALAAYPVEAGRTILPPLGVGLSGQCYLQWRGTGSGSGSGGAARGGKPADKAAETNRARTWLQRAVRGIELELLREVSRRIDAVQRGLHGVLAEAVDHGILLA
jgi:hypothetical protein